MHTPTRFALVSAVLFGLGFMLLPRGVSAAAIVVNTGADNSTSGDGFCTLREAITNSNNDAATSADCAAGTGADTITFAADYTITLGSTLPDINDVDGLTITGNGPSQTIVQAAASAGTATYRIVKIGIAGVATLEAMTFRYGVEASGGALNMQGFTLNLNHMLITENQVKTTGGSSLNGGGLSINAGDVTISNSTLSHNSIVDTDADSSHGHGGAIFESAGNVTLNNTTVSCNSAKRNGGGSYTSTTSAVMVINFSTIANNTSDSDADGTGNGGGVARGFGSFTVKNSIVAGNKKGSSTENDCSGTTSGGYNLTGSGTGCSYASTGDVTVAAANVFTSVLGPLADNGGTTFTHALFGGSAAQDAVASGANGCGTAPADQDQRGFARPYNSQCDIGAYEIQAATPTPTSAATATPSETATPSTTPTATETATTAPTATPTSTATDTATPTG